MKRYIVLISMFLSFSFWCKGAEEQTPLTIRLEVKDVIEGELPFGAANLFKIVIENRSSKDIKLATSTASPWLVFSGFWKVNIDGPIIKECEEDYKKSYSVDQPGIGEVPSVVIPAKTVKRFDLNLPGVAEAGHYKIWVEYLGMKVPWPECYQGYLKSKEYTFEIKEATGIDKEIIQIWRKQNYGKPLCFFPLNMKPNILDAQELLNKFPTSTYSGWALRNYHFKYNVINQFEDEKARKERIEYKDKIIEFLRFNRNFHFSGELSSFAGYICSQLGDYSCACTKYKDALLLKWDIPMVSEKDKKEMIDRVKRRLNELKSKGLCRENN